MRERVVVCLRFFPPRFSQDQTHKTAAKTKKAIHVLSRLDLTKEMMTVNQLISGIHLVSPARESRAL